MKVNTKSEAKKAGSSSLDSTLTVSEFLAAAQLDSSLNAKSLISTFFGDLALPHGGKSWVENLVEIFSTLGISSRLVRTSLFRLVAENWLSSTRAGRRSYYQLTPHALSQTVLAESLIYGVSEDEWDGHWTMVFIVMKPVDVELRRQLEQELSWIGFGAVARHILAHPTVSEKLVAERAKKLGLSKSVVCMRAKNLSDSCEDIDISDRQLAAGCFPLNELGESYQSFIDTFSRLDIGSLQSSNNDPLQLIALRMFLIDEYRRIVLRDPHLPHALLPESWVGDKAYILCKELYHLLLEPTRIAYKELQEKAGGGLSSDNQQDYIDRFSA